MAKFNELSDNDRINYLKDEFVRSIEELLIDPAEIKKILPEDTFKKIMDYVPSLKAPECGCGTCLSMDKLEARVPEELQALVELAHKRCEERTY